MGKSKSKSNSRSISRWKWKLFSSSGGQKTNDSREEMGSQTTAISPSSGGSITSGTSGNSRSKSITKRKTSMTREDLGNTPKLAEEPTKIQEEKKEVKEEKKEEKRGSKEDKGVKKDGGGGGGGSGSKTEEPPSKTSDTKKKDQKKEEKEEASVFEEVQGPAAPAQSGTHGVKNKMRWKIDIEGVDTNGDQKMTEVLEKLVKLRNKHKTKKCKVLKANDKAATEEEEEKESQEDVIMNSARILQLIKMESLITKEIPESEQETLKAYCRSGDHEEKCEGMIEKIVLGVLNAVVQKNEFIRQIVIPGELRLFAVDERKSKLPMMALLMGRKDLLYVTWNKPNREVENTLDGTWTGMATKKGASVPVRSTLLG